MNVRFISEVIAHATANGGVTADCFNGTLNPEFGYMVANQAEAERWGDVLRLGNLDPSKISDFVNKRLPLFHAPNVYLGIWQDGDTWIIEPSYLVGTEYEALELAKERNEKAIWDNARKREIPNPSYREPSYHA